MSIKVEPPADIKIVTSSSIDVAGNVHIPSKANTDLGIHSKKKEYSIVGDGLYARVDGDTTPQWLLETIDLAINIQLSDALYNLDNASQELISAISEIELARNAYEEYINIDATVDRIIASRVEQLDARIDSANARITGIDQAYVSEDRAFAISGEQIQSSLTTPGGALYGAITQVNTVITALDDNLQDNFDYLQGFTNDTAFTLSLQINELRAELDGDFGESLALIHSQLSALASEQGATSARVDTLESTFNGLEASMEQRFMTFANPDGTAGAKYGMTLRTNGVKGPDGLPAAVIGGMTLTNDGVSVSTGFDVDTFWIGRANNFDGTYPFTVQDNKVYIREAVIPKISANLITTIGDNPQDIFYVDSAGKTRLSSDVIDTDLIQSKNWNAANKTGLRIDLSTGEFTIYGAQSSGTSGYMVINNSGIRVYDSRNASQASIELTV